MTDQEITALAREYAEWVTKDYGEHNAYIPGETATASIFLRWLLRRFCLVEKEASTNWIDVKLQLPEIRERVLICEKVANQYKTFIGKRIPFNDGWEWNQSREEDVVAWMPLPKYNPDLGKEVEP